MMMGTRRSSLRISGTVSSPFISGFDIEQNDIRAQLSKFRQRQAAIAGRAYHFERGIARERVGERFVDDHRVIHDKHARLGRSSQSFPSPYARPVTWPRRSSPALVCSRAHCPGRRC